MAGEVTNRELKRAYTRLLAAVTSILYDLDPDGVGSPIMPPDEYSDAAAALLPGLWAAKTASDASGVIRGSFPSADQRLLDALWAARLEIA
jgi:hypothetical protein